MISDDILCQNFKAYMLLERGYSENTRIAYLPTWYACINGWPRAAIL